MKANNFDGLRLIAALFVLYGHMCGLIGIMQPRPGPRLDRLGLLMFFSISGYLIAQSWSSDPDLRRFLAKRFLRIWPAFAAVVLITFGLAVAFGPTTFGDAGYLAKLVLLDRNLAVFTSSQFTELNGSLWTIPAEVHCYLVLAVISWLFPKHLPMATLAALLIWLMTYGIDGGDPNDAVPAKYFVCFFLAGAVIQRFPALLRWDRALLMAYVGYSMHRRAMDLFGLLLFVPIVSAFIGTRSWPVIRSAGRFGDLSYGIYLWAFPIQQLTILWLGKTAPIEQLTAVSLSGAIVMALLSWHLIEAPALRLKPRPVDPYAARTDEGCGLPTPSLAGRSTAT